MGPEKGKRNDCSCARGYIRGEECRGFPLFLLASERAFLCERGMCIMEFNVIKKMAEGACVIREDFFFRPTVAGNLRGFSEFCIALCCSGVARG